MTTKDEERKALAKIRKIVEALGDDSYLSAAFDGCFDIAEENIAFDWMTSPKVRWESALKKLEELRPYELRIKSLEARRDELLAQVQDGAEAVTREMERANVAETALAKAQEENIRLKAKLYDMMEKEV